MAFVLKCIVLTWLSLQMGVGPQHMHSPSRTHRWLAKYRERLQREVAAGADAAERVRVMNATNPRRVPFVLALWCVCVCVCMHVCARV